MHALSLIWTVVLLALPMMATTVHAEPDANSSEKQRVYIGTYTRNGSEGIYLCELDPKTGVLELVGLAGKANNPSFLAVTPDNRFLYAVSEVEDYAATGGGGVAAFSIDDESGQLTPLNHQPSGGRGPCHVSFDRQSKNVLVANYGSGSASVVPIADDGTLKDPSATVQHDGSSVNPDRQQGPHAHSINVSPDNRFAYVADLGLDKVLIYKLDASAGTLTPSDPPHAKLAPGAGPRHFAFHPSGKFAYVINELTSTVTAFAYEADRGALAELQTITTLPEDFAGNNTTAEVQVHPSGKYLYGSNRGHDSIALFAIDAATGKLTPLGHHASGGKTPRNFGIDPTGGYLLAAHQDSNSVVVHRIDPATGLLAATNHEVEIPTPVCVKFAPQ